MGIRIHKVLGYGADDIRIEGSAVTDDRFRISGLRNKEGWTAVTQRAIENHRKELLKAFEEEFVDEEKAAWLLDHVEREANVVYDMPAGTTRKVEAYHDFDSMPVLVLVPPGSQGWYRYDDPIDYYEAGQGMEPSFRVVNGVGALFPFVGEMRRFRGQRRLPREPCTLEAAHYNHMVGRWDPKIKPLVSGEDLDDLLGNWCPTLPWCLLTWMHLQKWITDKRGFADMLRPCIFTYWS